MIKPDINFNVSKKMLSLLWALAIGIIIYWITYFYSDVIHAADNACYHIFQRNFPAPDLVTALLCILCAEGLRKAKEWSIFAGMAAAGSLMFLALIDISFNLWNDIYIKSSGAVGTEIFINITCLASALIISNYLWKNRNQLFSFQVIK